MENLSFSLQNINFLLFIIPGFILVWTFRFFSRATKPIGEFEYAGLSFIWGVILVGATGKLAQFFINRHPANDPYGFSYSMWFVVFGLIIGWLGSFVARWQWVKKAINFIRPENFDKK